MLSLIRFCLSNLGPDTAVGSFKVNTVFAVTQKKIWPAARQDKDLNTHKQFAVQIVVHLHGRNLGNITAWRYMYVNEMLSNNDILPAYLFEI